MVKALYGIVLSCEGTRPEMLFLGDIVNETYMAAQRACLYNSRSVCTIQFAIWGRVIAATVASVASEQITHTLQSTGVVFPMHLGA